jgi:hypothetical protein
VRALYRAIAHPLAPQFASASPVRRGSNYHFRLEMTDGAMTVRADDGLYTIALPVEWAFGAGDHAVTFVSKVSNDYYLEHAFSYYPALKALDLTPRHEILRADTLNQAMGQPIKTRGPGATIVDCFSCHSTGPVTLTENGDVKISEAGIHCEVCHGPGGDHRDAASHGKLREAGQMISNPRNLSADGLNVLCGRCHRATDTSLDWNSVWSVRHQPPYLVRSRCFQNSGGKLSCLTCHDPHDPVRRGDAKYYNARCAVCHNTAVHPPSRSCLASKDSGCTACHMPAVTFGSHLNFANHWIGVYGKNQLKPVR